MGVRDTDGVMGVMGLRWTVLMKVLSPVMGVVAAAVNGRLVDVVIDVAVVVLAVPGVVMFATAAAATDDDDDDDDDDDEEEAEEEARATFTGIGRITCTHLYINSR